MASARRVGEGAISPCPTLSNARSAVLLAADGRAKNTIAGKPLSRQSRRAASGDLQLTRQDRFRIMRVGLLRVITAGCAAVPGRSRRRPPAPLGWRRERGAHGDDDAGQA